MRGANDHWTIGERVAFYRHRRGLSQGVLAGLVGRSEDWLSKIERGERDVARIDVAVELARSLRVTVGDLIGQPMLFETEQHDNDDDVPAVRDALMAPQRLSRRLYAHAADGPKVRHEHVLMRTEQGWDDYQRGRIGRVIGALPGLIGSAQYLENSATETGVGSGWAISARVHHLATTTLSQLGESDLAWIAAERAMYAADQSDDALVLTSAARAGVHALLAVGRYDDALNLGEAAATWAQAQPETSTNPAGLSLSGMLNLRMAIAAARRQDRTTATDLLRRAADNADELGHDANHWHTGFGPTNVNLHRVGAALDLGDARYVVDHAPTIDARHMPPERAASGWVDLARARAMLADDSASVDDLLTAEELAPQLVRHSAAARETVRTIYRRSHRSVNARLHGLAQRCHAVP